MTYQTIASILPSIAVILLATAFVRQSLRISRLNELLFGLLRQYIDLKAELNRLKEWAAFRSGEVQEDHNQEGVNESDTEGKI